MWGTEFFLQGSSLCELTYYDQPQDQSTAVLGNSEVIDRTYAIQDEGRLETSMRE